MAWITIADSSRTPSNHASDRHQRHVQRVTINNMVAAKAHNNVQPTIVLNYIIKT